MPAGARGVFLARPEHRVVRVKRTGHVEAAQQFVRGERLV